MGTLLLDKSALQGLADSECERLAIKWNLLVPDILIYEILADVEKGKENEARMLAERMRKCDLRFNLPCTELVMRSLLGNDIRMIGIPLVLSHPREGCAEYVSRSLIDHIAERKITDQELRVAKEWNARVSALDAESHFRAMKATLRDIPFKDNEEIFEFVNRMLSDAGKTRMLIEYLKELIRIPDAIYARIQNRLSRCPEVTLVEFAGYAAFFLKLDLYFHLALGTQIVTTARNNRSDHIYLCYIPFCRCFITKDRRQYESAKLFRFEWQKVMYLQESSTQDQLR